MTANAENLVTAAKGQVFVAPTSAAAPTDSASALSVDWIDVGFTTEDGATLHVERTFRATKAWQALDEIAKRVVDRMTSVAFTMLEWTKDTMVLAFGGGVVTTGATGGVSEVQAVVLTGFSGTDDFKLTYGGQESAIVTRGTNYTAAGIKARIEAISGVAFTVTVSDVVDDGFIVTYDDAAVRTALSVTSPTGCTGVVGSMVDGVAAVPGESVYSPPAADDGADERSFVVQWQDGAKNYRVYIPRGMTSGAIDAVLARTDDAKLPVTFDALGEVDVDPFTFFTNDPSFA